MRRLLLILVVGLIAASSATAREYVVDGQAAQASDENPGSADRPLKTIGKAAALVMPGDCVTVRPGVYRESVHLKRSGTAEAPIVFQAEKLGPVVVSGADVVTGWTKVEDDPAIYRVAWPHVFAIDWHDGKPVEHHPGDAPLWGRAEQVIVDGKQCLPAATLKGIRKGLGDYQDPEGPGDRPYLVGPLPNLGGRFRGVFYVDTAKKELYLALADRTDPTKHEVQASTRGQTFGVNPWEQKDGVSHVQVRNFVFRYGATFPQRPALWLHGSHNLVENCVVEEMAGGGVAVGGTLRRTIVRGCGHTGGGAGGSGFLNEECLWEGNCWKPIDRGWDAGGFKMAMVDGGVFRRCVFRRNGGPGLWFDIHVRNVLVTECVFQENEGSGLFIEISRDIQAVHNLARGVVGKVGDGDWSGAGIQMGESQNCLVAFNTCVGNKDGITFREQGPRPLQTEDFGEWPYHCAGDVVVGNVCAYNMGYQLGLWYDNGFFGRHPADEKKYKTEEEFAALLKAENVFDPTKQGLIIDRNVYFGAPGKAPVLYGVPWRVKHQEFADLAKFAAATGFDARSVVAEPKFAGPWAVNGRLLPEGPAWAMQAGWIRAPADIDAWMATWLPASHQ